MRGQRYSATVPYRYILSLLFLSYVVAFIDRGLVAVAGAPIKQELALSDFQFGLLNGTAFVALYCLCGIPLGWLADRTQRSLVIAVGLIFWSTMTAVCALATSFAGFFVARIGVGFGEACLVPAALSLLGSVVPGDRMGKSIALFLMGATVGNGIALVTGGYILERFGAAAISVSLLGDIAPWRALFLLASIPGMLLAVFFLAIREPARASIASGPIHAFKDALRLLWSNRGPYGFLTASTACIIVLSQAQAAWTPLFFVRSYGIAPGPSALLVGGLFSISAPVGQWFGGILIDQLNARGSAAAPSIVQAASSLLCIPAAIIFCLSKRIECSAIAYVAFNFLAFAATPAGLTGWQFLTPARSKGLVVALLVAAVTLAGVGLGIPAVGFMTDHYFHDESALGRSLLAVILAAAVTGCATAILAQRVLAAAALRARSA